MVEDYHYLRRVNPDSAPKNYETRLVTRNNDIKDIHMIVAMIPGTKRAWFLFLILLNVKSLRIILKIVKAKRDFVKRNSSQSKNNLQVISSLLSLQKHQFGDTETADILNECKEGSGQWQ